MHLAEHDRACLTRRGPPALHATFERAGLAFRKPPGMFLLEPVKQRFGLQARLRFEPFLGFMPQVGQRAPVTLIKTGVASIKIDDHNTYTGGTYINQGRFQLAGSEAGTPSPDGLGSGPVTVAPGGYLFVSGVNSATILFNGPGAIPGALVNTAQNAPLPTSSRGTRRRAKRPARRRSSRGKPRPARAG